MKKYYSISEAAQLLGTSTELLRHYERKALIDPRRDKNGYRVFTRGDLYRLTSIRKLRKTGFSLDEVKKFHDMSIKDATAINMKRIEEIESEIQYYQLTLKALREQCEDMMRIEAESGKISMTTCPAMLRINFLENNEFLIDDKDSYARWVEHMPIVFISPKFTRESLYKSSDYISFGYCVALDTAKILGLCDTPHCVTVDASDCLTTIVYSENEEFLDASYLSHIPEYCENNGLIITGDIWGRTLGAYDEDNHHMRYHRIYIPVSRLARG